MLTRKPMKQSDILEVTLHYARTGEIRDVLIPYFDQRGHWIGDRRSWRRSTFITAICHMRGAILPKSRTISRGPDGARLLTSFAWRKATPVLIPWLAVIGSIRIPANVNITAPDLAFVGGHFHSKTTKDVDLPALREVEGDFDLIGTWSLYAPQLCRVGGTAQVSDFKLDALETVGKRLWMRTTQLADAPRLQTVGADLDTQGAERLSAPHLQSVGRHLAVGYWTTRAEIPKLETVGGQFLAEGATVITAHKLKFVGGCVDTRSAADFYRPDLSVGEIWEKHPEAKNRWTCKEAARRALTDHSPIYL